MHLERAEPAVLVVERGEVRGRPRSASPRASLRSSPRAWAGRSGRGRTRRSSRAGSPAGRPSASRSTTPPGSSSGPSALLERRAVDPERVVVLRHQRRGHRAGHAVERSELGRLRRVALAPARGDAASRPPARARAPPRRARAPRHASALPRAGPAAARATGGEVDVRVGEAGQHAAAAELDARGVRRRPLGDDPGAHRQLLLAGGGSGSSVLTDPPSKKRSTGRHLAAAALTLARRPRAGTRAA